MEENPEYKRVKPARSTEHHFYLLKERNLLIEEGEEISIKNKIRKIGYFRLSGYFRPFQVPKDRFRDGIRFKDILRLYYFDDDLRRITSDALEVLEISLKAKLTDIYSSVYESDWYLNRELFMTKKTIKQKQIQYSCDENIVVTKKVEVDVNVYNSIIESINICIERNDEKEYIIKLREKYGEESIIPSWIMMECITLGTLSRLYSVIKPSSLKKTISSQFGASSCDMFLSWLHGFTVLRNLCAHHSRIWNTHQPKELQFPEKEEQKFLSENSELKMFYGVSGCLLKSLKEISFDIAKKFKFDFYTLVDKSQIDITAMGFPKTFGESDIWKRE